MPRKRKSYPELEAQRLVDAAAAEALRDQLANSDTALTAMTLALEEQRRDAENTLTLLAAAQAAREDLDTNLAIALLAQQEAEAAAQALGVDRADLASRLAAALEDRTSQAQSRAALEDQLAAALIARTEMQTALDTAADERATLGSELAAAVAALAATQVSGTAAAQDLDRQAALLAQANAALSQQEALSAESQRQVALLNEQVAALRGELGRLQGLLNLVNDRCGGTFDDINAVIPASERDDFMASYKAAAGFAKDALNAAPPTIPPGATVTRAAAE